MNINYILAGASFLVGAAVSGVITWMVTKKRCELKHQEELDAVWKDISQSDTPKPAAEKVTADTRSIEDAVLHKPDLNEYANRIRKENYTAPNLPRTNDFIYEIDQNDLDEDEYQIIELTLYADGILADDGDYPIRDTDITVGTEFLSIMNGKDEAFIRNEKTKIDYDICRSQLTFGEMLERNPPTEKRLEFDDAVEDFYEATHNRDGDDIDDDDEYEEDDDE